MDKTGIPRPVGRYSPCGRKDTGWHRKGDKRRINIVLRELEHPVFA